MFSLPLTVLLVSSLGALVAAGPTPCPCGQTWMTLNIAGTQDTPTTAGKTCTPKVGVTYGDCDKYAATAKTGNAVCQRIPMQGNVYKCCWQKVAATFATPGPGSTLATLGPGTTPTPQDHKPICPKGGQSSYTGGNTAQACNITKSVNQNCPPYYTCTKADNVVDTQGTPTLDDDLGAGFAPYVCCKDSTMNSFPAYFNEQGLSTFFTTSALVPGVLSIKLKAGTVFHGDDWSFFPKQLAGGNLFAALDVTFREPTEAAYNYHFLLFDTGAPAKENVFISNQPGVDGNPKITLAAPAATAGAVFTYNAGPANAPIFKWGDTYATADTGPEQLGTFNTAPKLYCLLVWRTTAPITFNTGTTTVLDKLKVTAGAAGDWEPTTTKPAGGTFVNNSVLIKTRIEKAIGKAWTGMCFKLKT